MSSPQQTNHAKRAKKPNRSNVEIAAEKALKEARKEMKAAKKAAKERVREAEEQVREAEERQVREAEEQVREAEERQVREAEEQVREAEERVREAEEQRQREATREYKKQKKAAKKGYATAQNNLGTMYYEGRGVPQSDALAVEWIRKAADQGNANAQFNLGLMYRKGKGVHQSDALAAEWFRKAADQGDADAQNYLEVMYEQRRAAETLRKRNALAAEKLRKRNETDIKQVKKDAKKDVKEAQDKSRKLKKGCSLMGCAFVCATGELLTKENPDGFSTGALTQAVVNRLPKGMTIWATRCDERTQGTGEYDQHASIRSFLYEISVSSSQCWYKFGKPTNAALPTGGFVNKALAMRNAEVGWEVSGIGKGRAKASVRGKWIFVNEFKFLDGRWDEEKYGPLPMDREKQDETRKQGVRA
jgi:TPR repeat protein